MSKSMIHLAAALLMVAAVIGCGGQKPAQVEKPAEPAFTAQVKTVDAMVVASIAKMGPYTGVGDAVTALMKWVTDKQITPAGAPFGLFTDDPAKVKPESLKWMVCVGVPDGTKGDKKAGITVEKMAPQMIASTIHAGAYATVGETYGKLMKWVADNKYEIAGPSVEYFTNAPGTPDSLLKTEVGFVVKEAAPAPESGAAAPTGEKKELPPPTKK
jgi:DNA gyrase inhibitor GyrI